MQLLLILVGIGLLCAVCASNDRHVQQWRDELPPDVGHTMYPGHFDLGELVGCLVLAIIALVLIATLSGGFQ